MVRAYDDNGNVVDLVKWEKQIRVEERKKGYDEGYKQGKADMQEFVEQRCKELGIDYISIFTCEKGGAE